MTAIIDIRDLQFSWTADGPLVLDIEHFVVKHGERVFLQGPSGSGKTSLLALTGGIVTPRKGEIHVLGKRIDSLGGARRDRFRADHIGFIFQMFNLIPYLSLVENVTLPCRFSDKRRQKAQDGSRGLEQFAAELLRNLGLDVDTLYGRQVVELSVGQQQRVAVARALIGDPELIIADEPTSALDTDTREAFLDLLFRELERSGTTLVFVSHDGSLADRFDRSIELDTINRASGAN